MRSLGIAGCFLVMVVVLCAKAYSLPNNTSVDDVNMVTIKPSEYKHALRNPLKGFRPGLGSPFASNEYVMITRKYIRWNQLENSEGDTTQKIIDFCNDQWAGIEEQGIKVIPRVYLDWDKKTGNEHWPADMTSRDFSSEQFKQRLVRLIHRLGEVWDNDPRVAWVQMGIIGFWGEHHNPHPSKEIQKLMGDAFSAAFTNKKVLVRHATEFTDYEFGIYWDSWAHIQQVNNKHHGAGIERLNNTTERWKTCPIEGETAYNWGRWKTQPGDDPNDTLADPVHREFLIDTIRKLHCTGLGWIADYDQSNEEVRAGAEEVQKAFGYRFVIEQFSCSRRIDPGGVLNLEFSVINTGSAPFYEDWPLEFSLLNPETYEPVWTTILENVDIRQWLPGDNWDEASNTYLMAPETNIINASIQVPALSRISAGEYIVALSILDPIGLQPNLKFAVNNYLTGGRQPFCLIGVGVDSESGPELSSEIFTDPMRDIPCAYKVQPSVF